MCVAAPVGWLYVAYYAAEERVGAGAPTAAAHKPALRGQRGRGGGSGGGGGGWVRGEERSCWEEGGGRGTAVLLGPFC